MLHYVVYCVSVYFMKNIVKCSFAVDKLQGFVLPMVHGSGQLGTSVPAKEI